MKIFPSWMCCTVLTHAFFGTDPQKSIENTQGVLEQQDVERQLVPDEQEAERQLRAAPLENILRVLPAWQGPVPPDIKDIIKEKFRAAQRELDARYPHTIYFDQARMNEITPAQLIPRSPSEPKRKTE